MMNLVETNQQMLQDALKLAAAYKGCTAPNPAVGAIVVKDGKVVGVGAHKRAGTAHAEVNALAQAGTKAQDATLYVTLEPCCHQGKTPPCTTAIIAAGINRVVYGYQDPNPLMQGQGINKLQQASIACEYHPLREINDFYRSYAYWQQHKTPWLSAKIAVSADNKIAGKGGERVTISGKECNGFTHQQRKQVDAILSTVVTINNDDPQLNVRLNGLVCAKKVYVVDRTLQIKSELQLYQTTESLTIFHQEKLIDTQQQRREQLEDRGIRCISIPVHQNHLDLKVLLQHIGRDGIHHLWVETGSRFFNVLASQTLINEAYIYQAPHCLGEEAYSFIGDIKVLARQAIATEMSTLGKDSVTRYLFKKVRSLSI